MTAVFAAKLQKENISGVTGHFRAGYSNYSMSSTNAWLRDFYFTIRNDFVSFRGSGYAVRNNLIIGSEGTGLTGVYIGT